MHSNFLRLRDVHASRLCFAIGFAITSLSASGQSPQSSAAIDAASGKMPSLSAASTSQPPTAPIVAATSKLAAAEPVVKKDPVVETDTAIIPKGKKAIHLSLPKADAEAETGGVVAPSKLTRKQDEIDQLDKDDQIQSKRLSIASKLKQQRMLSGADDMRLRGEMKVMGIEGRTRDLVATIRYASGEEFEVRTGDTMPDGKKIKAISSTGITLTNGKSTVNLPITLASGRATAPRSDGLPPERVMVPMGGAIPPPSGMGR